METYLKQLKNHIILERRSEWTDGQYEIELYDIVYMFKSGPEQNSKVYGINADYWKEVIFRMTAHIDELPSRIAKKDRP